MKKLAGIILVVLISFILVGAGPDNVRPGKIKAERVKAKIKGVPPGAKHIKDAVLVRIVSLKSAQKPNGRWYWAVKLKNIHQTNAVEPNRLELKAWQNTDVPNKKLSAGSDRVPFEMPVGTEFNTTHYLWDPSSRTKALTVEVWDTRYRKKLQSKRINLKIGNHQATHNNPLGNSTAAQAQQASEGIKKGIEFVAGKYKGRGKWFLRIKNTGSYTTRKGDFKYYWRYILKNSSVPSNDRWMGGKEMPSILYKRTIALEGEGLYDQDQPDCLVKQVHFKVIDPIGPKVYKYTIDVPPPNVSIDVYETNSTGPQSNLSAQRKNFDAMASVRNNSSYGLRVAVHYQISGYGENQKSCYNEARKMKSGTAIIGVGPGFTSTVKLMDNVQDIIMGTYDTNLFYGYNSAIKIMARVVLTSSELCSAPVDLDSDEQCEHHIWYNDREGALDVTKEIVEDVIDLF